MPIPPLPAHDNMNLSTYTDSPRHSKIQINLHSYNTSLSTWQAVDLSTQTNHLTSEESLKVVSWNIDFSEANVAKRAATLIAYLHDRFSSCSHRLVILLQEVCAASLEQILRTPWLQEHFLVTDTTSPMISHNGTCEPAPYFSIILTPRNMAVERAFRIPFPSGMGRDGVFVDIAVKMSNQGDGSETKILRLCSTHLESLAHGKELRRRQMEIVAKAMNVKENPSVVACLTGGDMNSINDEEDHWPAELGLTDIWMQSSTDSATNKDVTVADLPEDIIRGYTWGVQPRHPDFPPNRFDKFFCTGGLQTFSEEYPDHPMKSVQRIGMGLRIETDTHGGGRRWNPNGLLWATDHLGVMTEVRVL